MKKLCLILFSIFILSCNVTFADEYNPQEFIDKFSGCVVYQTADSSLQKQILGWRAGKCIYVEKNSFGHVTKCVFTDEQIKEISDSMKIYGYSDKEITLKYTNGDEETFDSGYASVRFWAKYLNMPGVCQRQP